MVGMKHQSTLRRLKRQAEVSSYLGTVLVLISGLVLYTHKIVDYYNIQSTYEFKYYGSLDVFLWTTSGTITPLILIICFWLKPQKWALASPVAAYSVQMMYIFRDEHWVSRDYFWHSTIVFMASFFLLVLAFKMRRSIIESLKDKIRFMGDKIFISAIQDNHVKNAERWSKEIIEPTLSKLDEK